MLNGVAVVLLYFLVNFIKIEPVIAGALIFASKLFDAFIDPPIGMLSDRTRSRWGRRRPWLLGGSFFCGLSFALLFNVPDDVGAGTSMGAAYLYVSFWLFIYTVAYAVFTVPYLAMPGELTDDYHERNRLMSWRTVFMTLGTLTGAAAAPALVSVLGDDRAAYGQVGWILGAVIAVSMFLTFAGTAGSRQVQRDERRVSLLENVRLLRLNQPLVVLMATKIVLYAGIAAFTAVMLFFFSNVLKKSPAQMGAFFGLFSLFTIALTPVQLWFAKRVEKRTAYMVCLAGYALGILSWLASGPAEPQALLILRALWLGAFNAGLFLYGYSMLVDTYAWDAARTGLRREGFLASAISFVEKFSLAVGPLIIGALLSAMGFDKTLKPGADQSASAELAMVIGYVWIPVATQLLALGMMYWYRLSRQDLEAATRAG
jgi:glycoside/pentoside/hexuronide:cation symporter, GPH family